MTDNIYLVRLNLFHLTERQRHDRFFVDRQGELKSMNWIQNIFYDISAAYRQSVQAGVKKVVRETLSCISYGQISMSDVEISKLIFTKIFPLNHKIFDPSELQGKIQTIVKKRAEELRAELSQDQNILQLDHEIGVANSWEKQELIVYREKLMRAFIGLKMNLSHRSNVHNNGWSGAYFWRDYETGKIVGVYKPCDEDSLSPNSPKLYARIRYHAKKFIFSMQQVGKAHLAEAMTRTVSEEMHTAYLHTVQAQPSLSFRTESPIVPPTRVVHVFQSSGLTKPGIGSFQLFLDKPKDMREIALVTKNYENVVDETDEEFKARLTADRNLLAQYQWLTILHFIVGAQDTHAENILGITNTKGKTELKAIDNGMGLSHLHPKLIESSRIMEQCKLPMAEEPLLPEVKALLKTLIQEKRIEHLKDRMVTAYTSSGNFPATGEPDTRAVAEARHAQMVARLQVLDKMALDNTPLSRLIDYAQKAPQRQYLTTISSLRELS